MSSATLNMRPTKILSARRSATGPAEKRVNKFEVIYEPEAAAPPATAEPAEADQESVRREFMNAVAEGLKHLPQHQRQIVTMRYYESRSLTEIAEALDIREATVRTLLQHGVNNLRRQFKKSYIND